MFAENTVPHMLSGKAIAQATLIASNIFDTNQPDNNAVDIMKKNQDRHNMNERSDVIITLDINEQVALMQPIQRQKKP